MRSMTVRAAGLSEPARDGDIAAVYGFGFPAFRGGPLRYIDRLTAPTVLAQLEALEGRLGPRFAAAQCLRRMAPSRETFYQRNDG